MTDIVRRVAMVSVHTSPAAHPGNSDAGGMNVAILETARALATRGVEVDLITRATRHRGATAIAPGVTLHELPIGPPHEIPKDELPQLADAFGEAVAGLSGRGAPRYDIIHSHYWLSGIAALPVALELGVPFIHSFHTLAAIKNSRIAVGDTQESQRRVMSERYLASQADALVASSAFEATALIDEVGAAAQSVWVVPPGVDLTLFSPLTSASDSLLSIQRLAPGRAVLALVARIQPLKGHELAIRALAALSHPRPLLVIAGAPTPGSESYLSHLRSLVSELDLESDVRFLGTLNREDIASLLARADITLIPSHSETFGLVALESAASGTPVIAAMSTGLVESVHPGESGVLIDSREPRDWATVISGMLGDELTRGAMSQTARRFAENFSWGATATGLLGVYAAVHSRA
ncbi:MAG: glycosyltransferase [Microbacteriaceae bacterium]